MNQIIFKMYKLINTNLNNIHILKIKNNEKNILVLVRSYFIINCKLFGFVSKHNHSLVYLKKTTHANNKNVVLQILFIEYECLTRINLFIIVFIFK